MKEEDFNEVLIESNDMFEDESDSIQEDDVETNYLENYEPDKQSPSKKTIAATCAIIVIIVSVVILCI